MAEQELLQEPEEVKEDKIDKLERLFGTVDSSSVIAYTALVLGCLMILGGVIYAPDQLHVIIPVALAIIMAFTGVHIGVKASLNSVAASSEWVEFFKPFVPILELIASKVEEFAKEPQQPQPPSEEPQPPTG